MCLHKGRCPMARTHKYPRGSGSAHNYLVHLPRQCTTACLSRSFDYSCVPQGKFQLLFDGKPLRTPARLPLAMPNRGLALAVAAEWQWQVLPSFWLILSRDLYPAYCNVIGTMARCMTEDAQVHGVPGQHEGPAIHDALHLLGSNCHRSGAAHDSCIRQSASTKQITSKST